MRTFLRIGVRVLAAGLLGALMTTTVYAKLGVPKSDLWSVWDRSDETSTATIDHSAWQALLYKFLDTGHASGVNRFDYASVTELDHAVLEGYIRSLVAIDPRAYNRAEQLAYWINLYNAATVELIVEKYPVKSIRKIYGGVLGKGPWHRKIITVAGEKLSLNDIEHRILRPIYKDPRIHYAVNCASIGCPNLAAEAYAGANVGSLMDSGARAYVNHARGVRFYKGILRLSSIYNWFDVDFGADRQALMEHLAKFANPGLATQLRGYTGKIKFDYDWKLNAP